jgi:hypothetical protein
MNGGASEIASSCYGGERYEGRYVEAEVEIKVEVRSRRLLGTGVARNADAIGGMYFCTVAAVNKQNARYRTRTAGGGAGQWCFEWKQLEHGRWPQRSHDNDAVNVQLAGWLAG